MSLAEKNRFCVRKTHYSCISSQHERHVSSGGYDSTLFTLSSLKRVLCPSVSVVCESVMKANTLTLFTSIPLHLFLFPLISSPFPFLFSLSFSKGLTNGGLFRKCSRKFNRYLQ
ncbi:hypothetical protein GOODEAATRI_000624 [Goodea atripinnis]|uniref:Transmembrane protein n=1 Tax=Goodea atripinnis TaxID=208336 RepID=A0ABV0NQR0_9TELE